MLTILIQGRLCLHRILDLFNCYNMYINAFGLLLFYINLVLRIFLRNFFVCQHAYEDSTYVPSLMIYNTLIWM